MTNLADDVVLERLTAPAGYDLDAITTLESESFSNPWSPEALAAMLRSTITRLYVARQGDHGIVAFCACWVVGDELHINTVAVARPHRRRGIATRLLQFVLEETNARRATLEVRESNRAAIVLYEKLGFRTTAVRKAYYRNPDEDGLILWLNP